MLSRKELGGNFASLSEEFLISPEISPREEHSRYINTKQTTKDSDAPSPSELLWSVFHFVSTFASTLSFAHRYCAKFLSAVWHLLGHALGFTARSLSQLAAGAM